MHLTLKDIHIYVEHRLSTCSCEHILHWQGDTNIGGIENLYPLPTFNQSDSRYSGSLIKNVRQNQAVDILYLQ